MRRLLTQCTFVNGISDETKAEDGEGKPIAAVKSVAACKLRDGLLVVFCSGGDIPESRVEDNTRC